MTQKKNGRRILLVRDTGSDGRKIMGYEINMMARKKKHGKRIKKIIR
jgi:hypothetical protein